MNPLLITGPKGYPVVYFLLDVLFIWFSVALFRMVRRRLREAYWTKPNVFFVSLFSFCVLRSLLLLVWPLIPGDSHDGGWIGVFDIPHLLLFLAYSTLLLVWAEFVWGPRPKRVRILKTCSPRFLFSIVNVVTFACTPLLWIASADDSSSALGKSLSMLFHFVTNLLMAVALLITGRSFRRLVLKLIRKHKVKNEKYQKKKVKQTWWFIFVAVLTFIVFGLFQFVSLRVSKRLDFKENIYLFVGIFTTEAILVACSIWTLDGMPPKDEKVTVPPPPPEKPKKQKKKKNELDEVKVEVDGEDGDEGNEDKGGGDDPAGGDKDSGQGQVDAVPDSPKSEPLPVSHGGRNNGSVPAEVEMGVLPRETPQ